MRCSHCKSHEVKKAHILCRHCIDILSVEVKQLHHTVVEDGSLCIACKRKLIVGGEFFIKQGKCFCNVHCASRYSWREVSCP